MSAVHESSNGNLPEWLDVDPSFVPSVDWLSILPYLTSLREGTVKGIADELLRCARVTDPSVEDRATALIYADKMVKSFRSKFNATVVDYQREREGLPSRREINRQRREAMMDAYFGGQCSNTFEPRP